MRRCAMCELCIVRELSGALAGIHSHEQTVMVRMPRPVRFSTDSGAWSAAVGILTAMRFSLIPYGLPYVVYHVKRDASASCSGARYPDLMGYRIDLDWGW